MQRVAVHFRVKAIQVAQYLRECGGTGNCIQYLVITYKRKESEKNRPESLACMPEKKNQLYFNIKENTQSKINRGFL